MIADSQIEQLFTKAIESLELKSPGRVIQLLTKHYELMLKWSRTFNLTSFRTAEKRIDRLYIDSLLYLKNIPDGISEIWDIGSGPGFPGIPMKVGCPELKLNIVEPRKKTTAFLSELRFALAAEIDFRIFPSRCDDSSFIERHNGKLELVVSKGLAPPVKAVKLINPLIKTAGHYITAINETTKTETENLPGWVKKSDETHHLPLTGKTTRHLLFQKTG